MCQAMRTWTLGHLWEVYSAPLLPGLLWVTMLEASRRPGVLLYVSIRQETPPYVTTGVLPWVTQPAPDSPVERTACLAQHLQALLAPGQPYGSAGSELHTLLREHMQSELKHHKSRCHAGLFMTF